MKINKRLWVKGIFWELSGIIVMYLLTRDLKISIGYVLIRLTMYVAYHEFWKKIKWGKK